MNQAKAKAKELWLIEYPEQLKIDPVVKFFKPSGVDVVGNPNKYTELVDYESFRTVCEALQELKKRWNHSGAEKTISYQIVTKALKDVGYE